MKHPIQNALPIVAAAYGEKFGIQVIFQGKQAKTNGHTITLPAVEMSSEEDKTVMWGYLAHEAAHIRYTDFSVVAKLNQPIKHALLNIVEDVRIERCLAKTYPGTLSSINSVITHLVDKKEICYPKVDSPLNLLQMTCLLTLRLRYLNQTALLPVQQKVEAAMKQAFPLAFNHFLDEHFKEVAHLISTQDALNWVHILLLNLMQLPDMEQSNQHTANPKSTNSKQSESPDTHHSQSGDKTNKPSLPSHSNGEHDSQGEKDDTESTTQPKPEFTRAQLDKIATDILSAHSDDVMEDLFDKAAKHINRLAKRADKTTVIDIGKVEHAIPNKSVRAIELLKQAQKESSLLRVQLRNWLVALQQIKPAPKQQGQRLIPKRIALSQAGETRLFKQYINKTAPNADIHLLVDRSSSMNRETYINGSVKSYNDIANQAALSLALALEGIVGISLGVTYFGKAGQTPALTTALRPNERVTPNAGKFYQYANGNTPMAQAIWFALHDVLKQTGKRKIILVLTDGKPSQHEETKDVIKLCLKHGIELVGIGIQETCVKELFPTHIVINEVSQLKTKLFSTMQRVLIE